MNMVKELAGAIAEIETLRRALLEMSPSAANRPQSPDTPTLIADAQHDLRRALAALHETESAIAERDTLLTERERLREALQKLVYLKDLKATIGSHNTDAEDEYYRDRDAAWQAARAALAADRPGIGERDIEAAAKWLASHHPEGSAKT